MTALHSRRRPFGVTLLDPNGSPVKIISGQFGSQMNAGCHLQLVVGGKYYPEFYPFVVTSTGTYPDTSIPLQFIQPPVWTFRAIDQNGTVQELVPFVALHATANGNSTKAVPVTDLTLIDFPTYQMSRERLDFPTFVNASITTILDQLATYFLFVDITVPNTFYNVIALGVTTGQLTNNSDLLNFAVPTYDVHSGTVLQHGSTLLSQVGHEWRINPFTGLWEWIDITYTEPQSFDSALLSDYQHVWDASRKCTQVCLTSARQSQTEADFTGTAPGFQTPTNFPNPLTGVEVFDRSLYGYADLVTLFDAEGGITGTVVLNDTPWPGRPTTTSNNPTTQISFGIYPPLSAPTATALLVKVHVQGVYPVTGVDASWKLQWPPVDTSTDPRPKAEPIRSSVIISAALAYLAAPLVLYLNQKGWFGFRGSSDDFLLTVVPGQLVNSGEGLPPGKIDALSITWNEKNCNSTIVGWEPLYLQGSPPPI